MSNILHNRIKPYTQEIIGDYQIGFMTVKLDKIHVIKRITENSHEFDKDIHLLFVDFRAAYDSIDKECMHAYRDQGQGNIMSEDIEIVTGLR